ncbi:MAG: hypothetical protein HYX56_00065 [Chloroflexi bacterium]|nr:hypothetical protein [Chloroflexota bacterium]
MKAVTINISRIPIPLREVIQSRAARRGQTPSQYVIALMRKDIEVNDVLDRLSRQRFPPGSRRTPRRRPAGA